MSEIWPRQYGTPLYVLDEDDFRSRCRDYRTRVRRRRRPLRRQGVPVPRGRSLDREEGLGLDVCSGGELAVALSAGFPPERITLHGNNKSLAELEQAIEAGVGHIVLDSFEEIARLGYLAEQARQAAQGA